MTQPSELLRAAMAANDLSVADVAILADVSTSTVYNLLNGTHRRVHEDTAAALEYALDVPSGSLFAPRDLTTDGGTPHSHFERAARQYGISTRFPEVCCPHCHLLVPQADICTECDRMMAVADFALAR